MCSLLVHLIRDDDPRGFIKDNPHNSVTEDIQLKIVFVAKRKTIGFLLVPGEIFDRFPGAP